MRASDPPTGGRRPIRSRGEGEVVVDAEYASLNGVDLAAAEEHLRPGSIGISSKEIAAGRPIGRRGRPEEVANVVSFLPRRRPRP